MCVPAEMIEGVCALAVEAATSRKSVARYLIVALAQWIMSTPANFGTDSKGRTDFLIKDFS